MHISLKQVLKQFAKSILTDRQLHQIKKIKHLQPLGELALQDFRVYHLGQIFPMKPHTLNLLVNDVCNSRCQMCLIWQQKKNKEMTSDELVKVLNDDLFSELKYIGVSGGEPTLRPDLPELFEVICSKKPKIAGTGIITNGIIETHVKERIIASAEVCRKYDVGFNVMISLDGIGEVHDTVRGRKNNFESAISLLRFFHNKTQIPTSFGCTITSTNAMYVDELLDFAKLEGLYGRFRVAEYIQRLYNDGQTDFIRSFDDKTLYHLALFFFRAEHDYEVNPIFQRTYRNIREMLVEGKPRKIGCPYQARAVVLTARGELLYCAPKSPTLGDALTASASKLYFSNVAKRKEILQNDCDNCIHDYHMPPTFRETLSNYLEDRRRSKYSCVNLLELASKQIKKRQIIENVSSLSSSKVLIVGWYGTETAGDKAILWAVVDKLRSRPNAPNSIYISSLYPFISQWTIKEMNLDNVSIVETYSKEFEAVCDEVDEVVVGGGPLMDIEPLNHILYAFIRAARNKAITRVEGCGVGPLNNALYVNVVAEIFRLSDCVMLRDQASANFSLQKFPMPRLTVVPDPATDYVHYIKKSGDLDKGLPLLSSLKKNVSCFLREWSTEYSGSLSEIEFTATKQAFESQLAQLIMAIAQVKNLGIHLLPMHTFHVGGDDRVFNRQFAQKLSGLAVKQQMQPSVDFARSTVSPLQILQSMYRAELSVCMRFHSVLFAETLGVPYLAIDYTNGEKIKAFLESKGKLDRLISLQDIALGRWKNRLKELLQIEAAIQPLGNVILD
jgi:MoaA/NifB/PqqE/SkfB family radical SAM enzyme/polysaccharide pyruvyl transferase WcaK-like protein